MSKIEFDEPGGKSHAPKKQKSSPVIEWVKKIGLAKNNKQATQILFIFVVIALFIGAYLFWSSFTEEIDPRYLDDPNTEDIAEPITP